MTPETRKIAHDALENIGVTALTSNFTDIDLFLSYGEQETSIALAVLDAAPQPPAKEGE